MIFLLYTGTSALIIYLCISSIFPTSRERRNIGHLCTENIRGGSQLTFLTQLEKVIIFRSIHFSWLTGRSNWPFRCLDCCLSWFRNAKLNIFLKRIDHTFIIAQLTGKGSRKMSARHLCAISTSSLFSIFLPRPKHCSGLPANRSVGARPQAEKKWLASWLSGYTVSAICDSHRICQT